VSIGAAVLDIVTLESAVDRALEWIDQGRQGVVMAVNPEKVRAISKDQALAEFNQQSGLAIPDGMGVVVAARLLGHHNVERVTGIDFCERLVANTAARRIPVFFYGAKPGVAQAAADRLTERFPGLIVAGVAHGYVPEDQMSVLVEKIQESGARVLFVALGSPLQERWISKHMACMKNVAIIQGVGGSFDVFAGNTPRAPDMWQKIGLEWFYRLLKQPSRLPRYIRLAAFFPVLARCAFSGKS
jgi:N-acetylglucosaminyldiphosphoundecaprenol N-acetyl-beta-D-mannosaminyltransferase